MHEFWAHSPDPVASVPPHLLSAHLREVARLAAENAEGFEIPQVQELLFTAGLLHDLGKYKLEFQLARLGYDPRTGQPRDPSGKRVDHSSLGAVVTYPIPSLPPSTRDALLAVSRVIAAHHAGLTDCAPFEARINERQHDPHRQEALNHAVNELPELREINSVLSRAHLNLSRTGQEFLTRMMLSCLVDADQTDTEGHCSPQVSAIRHREIASLATLQERLELDQARFEVDSELNALRREMYQHALDAASLGPGFFRLTMPTGAGKTRTSLAFALRHAREHSLRRVIYAIPFTSIIDQTAHVFRSILNHPGEENVLEHHSALEASRLGDEETALWTKLLTETWSAPLIVTTTVQLFESLFANKTSKIRKLHNISRSVIVLDEVQTLPTHLLIPILNALNELVRHFRVSVVLCTATQPALDRAAGFSFAELNDVRDIVPDSERYFRKLERVTYRIDVSRPSSWGDVAQAMLTTEQVLAIVNLRRHAQELYGLVNEADTDAFHLSTNMFPAHRRQQLGLIRRRLQRGQPCRVVSTQLIECGVDVDFPKVFRALGPLDAVVQAAGRCNREGRLRDPQGNLVRGEVWVFKPEDAVTPDGDYFVKVQKAESVLIRDLDLTSPDIFTDYFRSVYQDCETDAKGIQEQRERQNFDRVAREFRMIDGDTVPVVITTLKARERRFRLATPTALLEELESGRFGPRRELWRELQMYSVSIYRSRLPELSAYLRHVRLANGMEVELFEWTGLYDIRLGLVLEDDPARFVF